MVRDHRLYLDDIIEAVRRIKEFTNDMDFDDFKADIKTQDAVVRNLEIIGEASEKDGDARHIFIFAFTIIDFGKTFMLKTRT